MKYAGEGRLYLALEDNVYLYDMSDKKVKCLFGTDDNEYKSSLDTLYGYEIVQDGEDAQSIIAICSEKNEKLAVMFTAGESDTNTEASVKEKSEITVYPLYYAECIEMMTDMFRNNSDGVTVEYTWGTDDNSGVSVADAVSAINDMTSLISYIKSVDKPNYGNDLNIYEEVKNIQCAL